MDLQMHAALSKEMRAKQAQVKVVLRTAIAIEPDQRKLMSWYCDDGIAEFSNRTAHQIVNNGEADNLLCFLRAIIAGLRDWPILILGDSEAGLDE